MAASPADPSSTRGKAIVATAFGGHILRHASEPGPASHDGFGARFVFAPATQPAGAGNIRYAIDVERRDNPPPDHLAAALGPRAMERWGEIEVMAKLLDVPAHIMLRRVIADEGAGLAERFGLKILRCDTPDHWIVAGCMRLPVRE